MPIANRRLEEARGCDRSETSSFHGNGGSRRSAVCKRTELFLRTVAGATRRNCAADRRADSRSLSPLAERREADAGGSRRSHPRRRRHPNATGENNRGG